MDDLQELIGDSEKEQALIQYEEEMACQNDYIESTFAE
jgi:hypothetical protein